MFVPPDVLDDPTASEVPSQHLERGPGGRGLGDRELVLHLPPEAAGGVPHHRYREATLTVDEADDPLLDPWPFLLIVRTVRIVTAHVIGDIAPR